MTPVARKLRREMTFPERLLWSRLRRRGQGTEVRRQVQIGAYIVDFYAPAVRVVIEVDGRSHDGRGAADVKRQADLEDLGLRVVRVTNDAVVHRLTETVVYLAATLVP